MKSYTDIEQSKKLAEILPIESADMCFNMHNNTPPLTIPYSRFNDFLNMSHTPDFFIPCWSLAALLDILAKETHNIDEDGYIILSSYKGNWWNLSPINCISEEIKESNNPLDAAFQMICWLKENNKL